MRDTRIQFSFWSKISSAILAEKEGEKYNLLNFRFELPKIDGQNVILVKTVSSKIFRPK
jgi:hypothetical protein